jgi:hypothetical protein
MLRHACVVTMVLLVASGWGGGIIAQDAEAVIRGPGGSWPDRVELRTFEFDVIFAQRDIFRLDYDPKSPAESEQQFERYYFEIVPHTGVEHGIASAIVEVTRQSTNDLVCRGTLYEFEGLSKKQFCDDLRAGHWYAVEYVIPVPADIVLYGVNPIKPITGG